MERDSRILSLERLRAVCIFLVILSHVTAAWWFDVPLQSGTFAVLTVYTAAARICIPCFVMITGALLLGKPSSGDVRYVVRKRVLRTAVLLAFWAAAYALVRTALRFAGGLRGADLLRFFGEALASPMHLWYLYMLIGLYLVLPFLKVIAEDVQRRHWFLGIWAATAVLLPFLYRFLPLEGVIPFRVAEHLNIGLGYTGYCVLGYELRERSFTCGQERLLYSLGFAGLIGATAGAVLYCRTRSACDPFLYESFSPCIALLSAAVFVFFRLRLDGERGEREGRFVRACSENGLGIYLLHMFFNEAAILSGLNVPDGALWRAPLLSALIWVCSFSAAGIVRRIPFMKKRFC